jgi:PPOX class probable F420-dependent enzyme
MADRHVQSRLKKEHVIWLATVGPDSRPHSVPVWFWWDGESFLIYSLPGQKVNDIEANQSVQLHLNTDLGGDDVVRIDGSAKIARGEPPANMMPAYIRKYRERIKGYGWTPQYFAEQYHIAIRVRPTKFH